jgi:hypothetical protein
MACSTSESDLDVEASFRAGFDEHDVQFFRLALSFFCGHLSEQNEAELITNLQASTE